MENIVNNENFKQFIVVKFKNENFGINIKYIHNIVRLSKITRVPGAPPCYLGVINLRGEIIPVMSIRRKFKLDEDEFSNATRIIIVKINNEPIGLMVDQVVEVVQLSDDNIQKIVNENTEENNNYIYAIGKQEDGLVTLLNLKALLD